jgi:hypothetical protein
MAILALGFVGTAIGGSIGGTILGVTAASIGGFIGATAGGLIDNMLFAGSQKIEGPRLGDLTVTASTYGSPIPLIYGRENRVGGNIVWSSGLIETANSEESGGKGGPSVESTTYSYRVSLAVSLGEGRSAVFGTWPKLTRIWANGKLIFNLAIAAPAPAAATANVGMVATKANGTHAVIDTVRFYQGTATQAVDPTIEAAKGVGDAPAYRHTMYAVLVDLQLADFGNVLPNLEFEIAADEAITDSAIVKDICGRAGEPLISSSQLTAPRRGFIVSRPGSAAAALEPLALAGAFDIADQGGQIRCVRRGRTLRATIPIGDMGAHDGSGGGGGNGGGGGPIRFERLDDLRLPREAALTFSDPALDYQPNTQRAVRGLGASQNNLAHEIPVTLTAGEGRAIADRLLWEAWSGRRGARFAVSDRWARLRTGHVVGVAVAGSTLPFKIQRATRGANGVIEMEARYEDPEIYASIAAGIPGILAANAVQLPGETRLTAMDAPLLRPGDDDAGFYWAVTGASDGWRGARVLRSSDGGANYAPMAQAAVRAAIGTVAAPLAAGPADFWDRGNILTVVLENDAAELVSASELATLSGRNAAWLGGVDGLAGEIVQFATATLIAPGTYELTDLLRGRLGTEHAIGAHGGGEIFVLLDPNTLKRTDFGAGDWDRERLYKPVSILAGEADTAAQAFTNTGEAKRPFSVVHIRGRRDTLAGDVTMTWVRRSRLLEPGLGYGPLPLGEESESYEIVIVVGGNAVNTYAAAAPSLVYTEAQQTADGITPGDPVTVRIYQLSTSRGRGRVAQATV